MNSYLELPVVLGSLLGNNLSSQRRILPTRPSTVSANTLNIII